MRRMLICTALAAAAALGGCHGKGARTGSDAAAASTPPAATLDGLAPAKAATPFAYDKREPDGEVSLKLARDIARWPRLHREVYLRGAAELRKFLADAKSDRDGMSGQDYQPGPYARNLEWTLAAATTRLVSLRQTWYENTGGAHPNNGYDTYLWDLAANRSIGDKLLFVPGDDSTIQKALCDGIDRAKHERGVEWDPESFPCPKWRETHFVLAPSTVPGKVGGLTFLFDPYAVGPFVEGEYEVTLPQSLFRPVLAPAYAGEFAGEPRPGVKKA